MPPPLPDLRISSDHARRFLVRRHLLGPPRSLPAKAASVLRVVDRLGSLQFDPLEVPGARNHDLVLHARIAGYQRDWLDKWLYGPVGKRRLIELYNKSLNILPITELPHYRLAWERAETWYRDRILKEQAPVVEAILERIQADGALSTAAFRDHNHSIDWWWAPISAGRAVMEALFVSGRLGIARRDGNRRYYDLIERLVPAELLKQRESEEDALRHRLLSRHRAVGLTGVVGVGDFLYGTGSAAERARRRAELVEAGELRSIAVEDLRGERFVLSEELPLLDATARLSRAKPALTFLAPLDPFVWDRRLLRELFAFDYVWEVYVPAAKRRWGYYVLPMLFGDRLVGRIEPKLERKTGTLRIVGVWFQAGFSPMEEPHFVPALAKALLAYRSFVGANTITWPRGRSGQFLAGALRAGSSS